MPTPIRLSSGSSWGGYRAFAVAMERDLPVLRLKHVYHVNDGQPKGPWWEMVFRTTA